MNSSFIYTVTRSLREPVVPSSLDFDKFLNETRDPLPLFIAGLRFIDTLVCHHYDVTFFPSHGNACMCSTVWESITVFVLLILCY